MAFDLLVISEARLAFVLVYALSLIGLTNHTATYMQWIDWQAGSLEHDLWLSRQQAIVSSRSPASVPVCVLVRS